MCIYGKLEGLGEVSNGPLTAIGAPYRCVFTSLFVAINGVQSRAINVKLYGN